MKTKHTAGPWKTTNATHPIIGWRITANDGSIAGVHKAGPRQSINECKANARLIAAAPDLAEVCKQICRYHDKILKDHGHIVTTDPWAYDLNDALWACSEKARAALAKLA